MFVGGRIVGRERAVAAPRRHHRGLVCEIDKAFQDGRRALEAFKRLGRFVRRRDFRLALAVIAEAARLDDAAAAQLGERLRTRLINSTSRRRTARSSSPSFSTKAFSLKTVLGDRQRLRTGTAPARVRTRWAMAWAGRILELECHRIAGYAAKAASVSRSS
jgi:N-acyl-D-aspartate/D-glutamate deacylase